MTGADTISSTLVDVLSVRYHEKIWIEVMN